jgi:hypothetical protein
MVPEAQQQRLFLVWVSVLWRLGLAGLLLGSG